MLQSISDEAFPFVRWYSQLYLISLLFKFNFTFSYWKFLLAFSYSYSSVFKPLLIQFSTPPFFSFLSTQQVWPITWCAPWARWCPAWRRVRGHGRQRPRCRTRAAAAATLCSRSLSRRDRRAKRPRGRGGHLAAAASYDWSIWREARARLPALAFIGWRWVVHIP